MDVDLDALGALGGHHDAERLELLTGRQVAEFGTLMAGQGLGDEG
jgi:hypothetical protein